MLLLGEVMLAWDPKGPDLDGAEKLYKRAVECEPGNADAVSFVAAVRD
jgi:hypothetical protein